MAWKEKTIQPGCGMFEVDGNGGGGGGISHFWILLEVFGNLLEQLAGKENDDLIMGG